MDEIFKIESISQLNNFFGKSETQHPLISIVDFSLIEDFAEKIPEKFTTELYSIVLKGQFYGTLKYGRGTYDFQEGTLVFLAPKQVISMDDEGVEEDVTPTHNGCSELGNIFSP